VSDAKLHLGLTESQALLNMVLVRSGYPSSRFRTETTSPKLSFILPLENLIC